MADHTPSEVTVLLQRAREDRPAACFSVSDQMDGAAARQGARETDRGQNVVHPVGVRLHDQLVGRLLEHGEQHRARHPEARLLGHEGIGRARHEDAERRTGATRPGPLPFDARQVRLGGD